MLDHPRPMTDIEEIRKIDPEFAAAVERSAETGEDFFCICDDKGKPLNGYQFISDQPTETDYFTITTKQIGNRKLRTIKLKMGG